MKISSFDWDEGNLNKLSKHKIPQEVIEEFLTGSNVHFANDLKHSLIEPRYIASGNLKGKYLFVVFTFRVNAGVLKIRIISARYIRAKELGRFHEKN